MLEMDIKLLEIFVEVFQTRNVSLAAENLRVSQPSVSIALGKLRTFFNDPLFVRTSFGLAPTPRAQQLQPDLLQCLQQLKSILQQQVRFDPATSTRTIRICTTDISQVVIVSRLLSRLKATAPLADLEILSISPDTGRLLETGEADLAIGLIPDLEAGFRQQNLFLQSFVCIVRADHPRIRDRITRPQFVKESHIHVRAQGTGHSMLDNAFKEHRINRQIALTLPDFLGIGVIVANSDLIATVPTRLARVLSETSTVKMIPPPVQLPTYQVNQHWHDRFHDDLRSRWLRNTVAGIFHDK